MSHIASELIDRYLAGEATAEDQAMVEAWLASRPEHAEVLEALRGALDVPARAHLRQALSGEEATWQRIRRRTVESRAADPVVTRVEQDVTPIAARVRSSSTFDGRHGAIMRPFERTAISARYWIGAVVVTCALAVAMLFWLRAPREVPPSRTYATRAGQRATVTLGDGSRVTLAPQSALVVSDAFGTMERRVVLRGEAYFQVRHTSRIPFVVQTGRITTRVIGTTFDVRHYPTDPDVRVTVVSGKVIAGAVSRPAVTLIAGAVGRLTDSTATAAMSERVASDVAWVDGALVFHDTPLPDALARLGQWYGIELRLSDTAMARRHVTGVFDGESQAEALATLQTVLKVSMTFESTPGQVPVVTLVRRNAQGAPTENRSRLRDRRDFSHASTEVGR